MSEPIAYLNGKYLPISQANLHVFDLGIVGGVSVSEMVRTFRHMPFLLDQHLDRLQRSLESTGLDAKLTTTQWREICEKVVAENGKQIPDHHDLGLVAFVTAGPNPTYVGRLPDGPAPTVCVHTFPLPFELWAGCYKTGLHLAPVDVRSIPDDVIDSRIKHRSRLHWHLAARQAKRADPSAMAILTDGNGDLTETATGNLCVVDGSTIISPAAHVLEGISREYVAQLAAACGIGFVHAAVSASDLAHADEVFLTSTPHCLLPVTRFNGLPVGSGQPGPVYLQLIASWSQSVGVDIVEQMGRGAADRERAGVKSQ